MRIVLAVLALLVPGMTRADGSCDGLWKGHYIDRARAREAPVDMTIDGDAGVWIAHLGVNQKAKNSPCRDVKFPVQVLQCTESEFVFFVDGDSVLHGCPKFRARLQRRDANHADGVKGGNGKALEMVRQR